MSFITNSISLQSRKAPFWHKASFYQADGLSPMMISDFKNNRYAINGVARSFPEIFTVTRATPARYFGSDGILNEGAINTPRFDYDPDGSNELRGLLVEASATNYIKASQEFNNGTYWNKTGTVSPVITANSTIAPDGTMTADEFDLTPASDCRPNQVNHLTAGQNASQSTFSVWLKAKISGGTVALVVRAGNGVFYSSLVNITTTWDRYSLSVPATSSSAVGLVYIGNRTYGGTCLNFYAWGAQHELAGAASSYIQTTTSAVTRSADIVTNSASNTIKTVDYTHSGNYTVYAMYESYAPSTAGTTVVALDNGTANHNTRILNSLTGDITGEKTVSGVASTVTGPSYAADTEHRSAFGTNNTNMYFGVNGGSYTVAAAGLPNAPTAFTFGSNFGGTSYLSGWLKDVRYYNFLVSTPELERITT